LPRAYLSLQRKETANQLAGWVNPKACGKFFAWETAGSWIDPDNIKRSIVQSQTKEQCIVETNAADHGSQTKTLR
jgi:hypothetical protein